MFSVKWKLSRHTEGKGTSQCHQITQGGGGSKIGQQARIIWMDRYQLKILSPLGPTFNKPATSHACVDLPLLINDNFFFLSL